MRGKAGKFAAHKVCDSDLLRDCDGGGFVEPVAVRWGAVRVPGGGGKTLRRCIAGPGMRGSGRR